MKTAPQRYKNLILLYVSSGKISKEWKDPAWSGHRRGDSRKAFRRRDLKPIVDEPRVSRFVNAWDFRSAYEKQKQNQKQLPAGHESTLLIAVYKSTQRSVDGERPPSFLLPMETGGGQWKYTIKVLWWDRNSGRRCWSHHIQWACSR